MIPIGAVLVVAAGFALLAIFSALIGRAEEVQIAQERRPELYDWAQEPDL